MIRSIFATSLTAVFLLVVSDSSFGADETNRGETVYKGTCIACHGADGIGSFSGVPDLARLDGPLAQDENVLIKRIKDGYQSPDSPMAMPPFGGDPSLTKEDLNAVVQYMRKAFLHSK